MSQNEFDALDFGGESLDLAMQDSDSGLAELSRWVKKLAQVRAKRAEVEELVKQIKEEEDQIARVHIPDLFENLGLSGSIQTDTGLKVTVKQVVKASIKDANRDAAIQWFDDNNLSRMVKDEFTMKLNKGQNEEADKIREALDDLGVAYKNKKNVHPSTLSSFVKERLEAGEPVPEDILGVFKYNEAKIG
jgi:hypothetical protein